MLLSYDGHNFIPSDQHGSVAAWMMKHAPAIVDTLTTTPNSRARARKTNGAKRTRNRPVLQPAKLPEP